MSPAAGRAAPAARGDGGQGQGTGTTAPATAGEAGQHRGAGTAGPDPGLQGAGTAEPNPGLPAGRRAGLLLHPTSLPGPFGSGDLGPAAREFLRWAAGAGQRLWQVLPLGPTGSDRSPYSAASSFAGDPLLVSPNDLVEEGLLAAGELARAPRFPGGRAAEDAPAAREELLRASWRHFATAAPAAARRDLEAFLDSPKRAPWLEDWALFAALAADLGSRDWLRWPREVRLREPAALAAARRRLAPEIAFQRYAQFLFFRAWGRLRRLARELGIAVLGDLPIYAPLASADVWAHRGLFRLDGEGRPEAVAGVPPDDYSADGQLWGHPLYRWERLEETGFGFWVERLEAGLAQADLLRLDHFRGLVAFWEVPAGAETAAAGRWVEAPGRRLFRALRQALGELPLVAEDLGVITPDVTALRRELGLPGMKVLQFAFSRQDSEHLPHHARPDSVVYTGTHDNPPTRAWFAALGPEERERVLAYLDGDGTEVEWDLIRAASTSVGRLAVVPAQDVLGLGEEGRMNVPGRAEGNWRWRLGEGQLTPELAGRLRRLAEVSGRSPERSEHRDSPSVPHPGAAGGSGHERPGGTTAREGAEPPPGSGRPDPREEDGSP